MEELFDIVNERDEVIGQRIRTEVHRLGLRHRAAHVLVYNASGQLFLQKRSMDKDCDPGVWDSSAAGHLVAGETYERCALRELREELAIHPEPLLTPLFKLSASPRTANEFAWIFRCVAEGPFILDEREIDEGKWIVPDDLDHWMSQRPEEFSRSLRVIWARLK